MVCRVCRLRRASRPMGEASSRSSSVATTGRRPTNSGIKPCLSRSSGSTSRKISPCFDPRAPCTLGAEADRARPAARRNNLVEASEGTATDEQDAGSVDLQEFLLRMLASALRRHTRHRAFYDLEQGLLHALARYVAGDRRVVGFAGNLVDLVDVDNAALRALDVVVGGLEQLENDVLDVFTNVAGFGQRGRRPPSWNGTSRIRASVCASSVLPEPVGPINRMFDFASSTSLC